MLRLTAFIVAATLLNTTTNVAAQASLWTVDDDGPADFSTVQAAVDAAASMLILY